MTERLHILGNQAGRFAASPGHYWHTHFGIKLAALVAGSVATCLLSAYGIGQWYIHSERNRPLVMGTSFIADYAQFLGLDPHQTFVALLDDLHIRHFRLVSYWSDIEHTKGTYDFSELDWEFQQADLKGAKITLAVGLRQPRWPECHMPDWAITEPVAAWEPQLDQFLAAVIERYRGNPALESYQLENEYFLTSFADCPDETRPRLVREARLVRQLDPKHPLIISRSQNAIGWPVGQPHADVYGISIYRRVWTPLLNRYITYPFPAWYYAFLAGAEKLWSSRDTVIHELQTEPWPQHSAPITRTSLAEQNKSFDAQQLRKTTAFGVATGMRSIDLWGAEYWYYRKTVLHDSSVWDEARQEYAYYGNH